MHQIGSDKWSMTKDRDRFAARGNFQFSSFSVVSDKSIKAIEDMADYSRVFLQPKYVAVKEEKSEPQ